MRGPHINTKQRLVCGASTRCAKVTVPEGDDVRVTSWEFMWYSSVLPILDLRFLDINIFVSRIMSLKSF